MAVWLLLGIAGLLFDRRGSYEAKRRWHPRFVVGAAILFLGFTWFAMPPVRIVALPAVALITWMNLRFTKFCPACAATQYNRVPWTPMRFCSKCGAALDSSE